MNKYYSLFLLLLALAVNSQAVIFEDDFEAYEDFTKNAGDWTIINADGNSDHTGFAMVTFPIISE